MRLQRRAHVREGGTVSGGRGKCRRLCMRFLHDTHGESDQELSRKDRWRMLFSSHARCIETPQYLSVTSRRSIELTDTRTDPAAHLPTVHRPPNGLLDSVHRCAAVSFCSLGARHPTDAPLIHEVWRSEHAGLGTVFPDWCALSVLPDPALAPSLPASFQCSHSPSHRSSSTEILLCSRRATAKIPPTTRFCATVKRRPAFAIQGRLALQTRSVRATTKDLDSGPLVVTRVGFGQQSKTLSHSSDCPDPW
jgi:hypothetical protein